MNAIIKEQAKEESDLLLDAFNNSYQARLCVEKVISVLTNFKKKSFDHELSPEIKIEILL